MAKNYYDILGVDRNATADDIKKAYKKLAVKYHPDKNQGSKEAEEKFKEINEAFQVLSDEEKKSRYDSTGDPNGGYGGFGGFGGMQDDVDDMFAKFRNAGFGFGRGGVAKGTSIQVVVSVTLEEVFSGVKTRIKYNKDVVCSHCKGNGSKNGNSLDTCTTCGGRGRVGLRHGQFVIENTCHHCGGYGKLIVEECEYCSGAGVGKKEVEMDVQIPVGVRDGWQTVIAGHGNDAITENKGVPGDLFLIISQLQHQYFEREGDNLIYRLNVPFTLAALGGKVEVPTIDGKKVEFELSECTPNGKFFRLKNRGLHSFVRKGFIGDMLVLVQIDMPSSLTEKERQKIKELSKEESFKIKKNETIKTK